jgi:hypothetical protein
MFPYAGLLSTVVVLYNSAEALLTPAAARAEKTRRPFMVIVGGV